MGGRGSKPKSEPQDQLELPTPTAAQNLSGKTVWSAVHLRFRLPPMVNASVAPYPHYAHTVSWTSAGTGGNEQTRSLGHFLKHLSLSLCAMLSSAATRRFLSALASRHRVATAAPSALRCFSTDAPPLPTPPRAPSEEQPRQQKETSAGASPAEPMRASEYDGSPRRQRAGSRTTDGAGKYEEEQARVLRAALPHVVSLRCAQARASWLCAKICVSRSRVTFVVLQVRMGWSESAMIAGARDAGVSPAIVGSIPRKEAALVEVNRRSFVDWSEINAYLTLFCLILLK